MQLTQMPASACLLACARGGDEVILIEVVYVFQTQNEKPNCMWRSKVLIDHDHLDV